MPIFQTTNAASSSEDRRRSNDDPLRLPLDTEPGQNRAIPRRITGDEYDKKARELKERQTEITLRIEQHQKGEGNYRTTLKTWRRPSGCCSSSARCSSSAWALNGRPARRSRWSNGHRAHAA